ELADAVTKDGWILGRRTLTLHDAGAYARFSPYGVTKHAFHHSGAYTIPNLRFDGFVCFTNRVPTTAMRGFGVTSVSFAVETHLARVAQVLGIDPWQLRLRNANRIGDTSGNGVTLKDPSTVPVTLAAAERVRERILDIASKELEIDPSDLEIANGEVTAKGAPQKSINVADVAGAATYNYGELISGSSTALKPFADVDDATGQVEIEPHSAISYAACVAEVEVDDETGDVVVLKMVQVYDVGRAINPTLVEGQIEGGAIMGLGLGLTEASYPHYPSPEHRGGEFGAYLGPAMEDLPELDNVILENPSEDGPFGAKAIGEMANNAQPPAIANAIFDAVGVWVTEMPATPERVLDALETRREAWRDGKRVVFDQHISVKTVSSNGGAGFLDVDA